MRKTYQFSPIILCAALFAAGLAMGFLGLRVLSPDEKAELISYLEVFMRGVHNPGLDKAAVFRLSLEQNAKTALLIWGFGLAVIGVPLTCVMVFVRGFATGFGASFVVREVTSGGVAMFLSGMLPHTLISIPAMLILSAMSISFSVSLFRERPWNYGGLWKTAAGYTWRFWLVALGLLVASAVEAFVSPLLLARMTGI
jgi:stage II sporulation protein M